MSNNRPYHCYLPIIKLFLKQLNNCVEKHTTLNEQQYGVWDNRSTSLAVMDVTENIDNRERVFIDLSKSFDRNNHLLLSKNEIITKKKN